MHSKWAGKEENEGTERVKRENNKEQRPSRVGVSLRKMVNNVRKEKQPRGSIFPKGRGRHCRQSVARKNLQVLINAAAQQQTTQETELNWTQRTSKTPKNQKYETQFLGGKLNMNRKLLEIKISLCERLPTISTLT